MNNTVNNKQPMCPFCHLLVEPELCDPIGYDFFGTPANVKGIPSCDGCAIVASLADDDGQYLVDMLKAEQAKQPA